MGKTEGNMAALNQTPEEIFGKVMSWGDNLIIPGFELFTLMPSEKLDLIKSEFESGRSNPKEYKITLAKEIIRTCFRNENINDQVAQKAAQSFIDTFSKKEFPEDAKVLCVSKTGKLIDILVDNKIVESKSEFRRLVEAGAVSDYPDKKINDPGDIVGETVRKIKIGKKTFVILRPE